jgi:hypothetical protein
MPKANSTFRFAALLGAAVAMSVPTAAIAQTIAPNEPSQQSKILVPRPDFPGAKQQEELQTDIGKTPRPDFPGPKQSETPAQTPNPTEK